MALCLIVEDDATLRELLSQLLEHVGYETVGAATGEEACRECERRHPEVVLLDLGLPDADGMALLPDLLRISPRSRVVVLTGRNSVPDAVAALRAGARHYLLKPWDDDELLVVVEREVRAADFSELNERTGDAGVFWGASREVLDVRKKIEKLARSPGTPVLIEGETGVGKEVVARELHRRSGCVGQFVAMNCAAIPSELMESELFGHEKGAFTGAEQRRRGLAELARNGTLFLDEIGELALPLQAKLLRFLQDHRFRRVGAEREMTSECRIVAATHRDLDRAEHEGRFRSDLFYRLTVVRLHVPPLRRRREDLLPLANFLLEGMSRPIARGHRQLDAAAERAILDHEWRGNVRELKNRLERALVLSEDEQIEARDLDLPVAAPGSGLALTEPAGDNEREQLRRVLEEAGWNVSRAARRLGVARHRIRYRMRKLDIKAPSGIVR